jgi:hypothetical protein
MRVERVVRVIEIFTQFKLGKKFNLEIDIILDDMFRCISITNKTISEISEEDIRTFLAMLYVEFGVYVSEIIDVMPGRMFNIYLHDDNHIRVEKIKNIMARNIN